MPISGKIARIGGALVVAVLLVAGGYVLPGLGSLQTKPVNAELTDELLAEYVSKDSDGDALPDWQEALYGTDAKKADSDGDGVPDGEAVSRGLLTPTALSSQLPTDPIGEEDIPGDGPAAGSFTDRFSRTFFEAYMRASGGEPMSAEAQQELITKLMGTFAAEAARSLSSSYTRTSMHTDASVSVTAYAGSVEQILMANIPDAPDSDMFVLAQQLIEEDRTEAAARLVVVGNQYTKAAAQLVAISVPPSYLDTHLKLVRALDQAGKGALAMSKYKEDPLLTMGALAVLTPASTDTMAALNTIAEGILAVGEPGAGSPGALILQSVRHNQQQ